MPGSSLTMPARSVRTSLRIFSCQSFIDELSATQRSLFPPSKKRDPGKTLFQCSSLHPMCPYASRGLHFQRKPKALGRPLLLLQKMNNQFSLGPLCKFPAESFNVQSFFHMPGTSTQDISVPDKNVLGKNVLAWDCENFGFSFCYLNLFQPGLNYFSL